MAPAPQYRTFKNQVPLGQGQTLGFTTGKGYYARGTLPQAAAGAGADPYSQLAGYQPLTAAQIQQQAQGEISPIIQAITGQATTQAQQAAGQIKGITDDYANELGQINFASPYQQAEPQQAAIDAALQQSLTGEGSSLAGGLSDRLSQLQGSSGAPALDQAAGQLASQGQSNGTTQLANGSAALSNLLANAAAGSDFGLKLPGIAKLSGIQALGQNDAAQTKAVNDATLQAESQLPSLIQDLTSNNQTELANAVNARQKQQALNFDNTIKNETLGLNAKKTNAAITQGGAKVSIAQQNANTAAERASASAQAAMARAQIAQENATTAAQKAKADSQYKAAEIKLKKAQTGTSKPLSVTESRVIASKANTIAEVAYKGGTDSKGGPLPQLSYQQALAEMRDEGLLANPQSAKVAIGALNRMYGEGERGRPVSKKSQAAFKAASTQMPPPPLDALTGGH
jgi:NADH dehydrogenase/NADH:ubiquinone oxidoreductase subunit G